MSKQSEYDKIKLLGVEVDAVSNAEAIAYIVQRAAPGRPAVYVAKPYVEFLDKAYRDSELRDLLNHAELSLADGVSLTWAAAYLYAGKHSLWRFWFTLFQIVLAPGELRWPLPDRAAGTNFTWPLLQASSIAGRKVFLIGQPKTAQSHTPHTPCSKPSRIYPSSARTPAAILPALPDKSATTGCATRPRP